MPKGVGKKSEKKPLEKGLSSINTLEAYRLRWELLLLMQQGTSCGVLSEQLDPHDPASKESEGITKVSFNVNS